MKKNNLKAFDPKKHPILLALISRMPLIKRWPLHRCFVTGGEDISQHTTAVSMIAYILAVIHNVKFNGKINIDKVVTCALHHDLIEVASQDVNRRLKYRTKALSKEFKKVEHKMESNIVNNLPEEFREYFDDVIIQADVDHEIKRLVKAADIFQSYLFVCEEMKANNPDFATTMKNNEEDMSVVLEKTPELQYLIDVFMPAMALGADDFNI